jgi:hypothetical protein
MTSASPTNPAKTTPLATFLNFQKLRRRTKPTNPTNTMTTGGLDLSNVLSSHKAQLVLTAVASGVVVGSSILAFQSARHQEKLKDIKRPNRRKSDATAVSFFASTERV